MIRRLLFMLAILAAVLPAGSCSLFKKHLLSRKYSPVPADKNSGVFIGMVESVNPEQKFVLIRTELRMVVAPGSKLESHSASGTKASLVVTPERKMNFLSADITEGSPSAGDVVIMSAQVAAAAAAAATPAAEPGSVAAPAMRPPASEPALPAPPR
jgi:hypothetical protein